MWTASGVNDQGQIAAAIVGGGAYQGVLVLTPVPVPAAVWLFGSGLAGLAGLARRRMKATV
jgi:hypothetical protein